MFPLKRRRKFARIYKEGLNAEVTINETVFNATMKDVSASGCNIEIDNCDIVIENGDVIEIKFILNDLAFAIKASKVRENAYNFIFEDRRVQTMLNNEVLVEYFKDSPELIPVGK